MAYSKDKACQRKLCVFISGGFFAAAGARWSGTVRPPSAVSFLAGCEPPVFWQHLSAWAGCLWPVFVTQGKDAATVGAGRHVVGSFEDMLGQPDQTLSVSNMW